MKKLLLLLLVFTGMVNTVRADYGWYDRSMTIGGITIDPSTLSGDPDNPTDLGVVSDMTITRIAFNVWSDANDRGGANMFFKVYDKDGQVGTDKDLWLGSATRITGDHDFAISYTDSYNLADAVGLNLEAGTTYYIDMYAKTYGSSGDEWYSNGGSNYHAKITIAPATYDVTAYLANGAYWATFYCQVDNYQAPEGTEVFAVSLSGSTLTMHPITDRIVKKDQGVVLKQVTASTDATTTITMTKTETIPAGDFSNNSLTGTMTSIPNPSNAYVLSNGDNGVGFYKLSDGGSIGANKAYLTYSAGAREFFGFDETTGINATQIDNGQLTIDNYYDLQGRRVAQPTKGLYIVNGKKVIK